MELRKYIKKLSGSCGMRSWRPEHADTGTARIAGCIMEKLFGDAGEVWGDETGYE